jgi:hypothetical protein
MTNIEFDIKKSMEELEAQKQHIFNGEEPCSYLTCKEPATNAVLTWTGYKATCNLHGLEAELQGYLVERNK